MRHEITRHCVTLGSALAIGLLSITSYSQAQQASAEPKQKALVSFKMNFLSRFKKDERPGEAPAESSPSASLPSEVVAASAVEPLPSQSAETLAVPATNIVAPQSLAAAAEQRQFPSVLPPSVPPVQLASGQFPLPAAGPMPFQTAQSPVVVMMPAGWQPDGSYTFAPRTVMSPEVPAEHWPTTQRNPLGDDSRKGLFDWPQIAKKITNSTVGEPDIKPRAPEPAPSTSRALFAGTAAPAMPQAQPAQQVLPIAPQALAVTTQAAPTATQDILPATPTQQVAAPAASAAEVEPASKALFAPKPKPEPQPEQSKTRALLSMLSKPMNKVETADAGQTSTPAGSRALFSLGPKKVEPAAAPAPAVVPQYAAETPLPPEQPTVTPITTVESLDSELQPPAPPSVSKPTPGKLQNAKSDDPKMKWRVKGAPAQVVEPPAVATDTDGESQPETVAFQDSQVMVESNQELAATAIDQPAAEPTLPAFSPQAANRHGQHQLASPVAETTPVSRGRSLFGKQFPSMSAQTPRNVNDSRSPWRRQAERDAIAAAEKQVEQPVANSKAILPQVAAMLPAAEKPSRPVHYHATPAMAAPAATARSVATVAATEDTTRRSHAVRRAHETSARSTDSYYAAPWESEVEAELNAIERRQIGAVSNRRAATARHNAARPNTDHQQIDRELDAVERQPRVPFEVDELEQEKAALRRSAKAESTPVTALPKSHARPKPTVQPKADSPAGSTSNGARLAEQQSKKSYRRLTGDDVKQTLTRPLAMFGDMTKLPSPLKAAADSFDRRRGEQPDETPDEYPGEGPEEFSDDEAIDSERSIQPVKSKRSAANREPVHELRQSMAAAANAAEREGNELQTSELQTGDRARPTTLGQRGGRRQVERTTRSNHAPQPLAEQDPVVVTAADAEEDETGAEINDERPVRPAMHIRNKHGNQVKIFTSDATAEGSGE